MGERGGPAAGARGAHPRGLPSELLPSPQPGRCVRGQPTVLSPAGSAGEFRAADPLGGGRGRPLARQDPAPPRLEPGVGAARLEPEGPAGGSWLPQGWWVEEEASQ